MQWPWTLVSVHKTCPSIVTGVESIKPQCTGGSALNGAARDHSNASGVTTAGAFGTCACDPGYQGLGCDRLTERTAPTSLLPILIAAIGLFLFILAVSVLRFWEACVLQVRNPHLHDIVLLA